MRTLLSLVAIGLLGWLVIPDRGTDFVQEVQARQYESTKGCTHSLHGIKEGRHRIRDIHHWGANCTYVWLQNGKSFKIPRDIGSIKHEYRGRPNTAIVQGGRVELTRLSTK